MSKTTMIHARMAIDLKEEVTKILKKTMIRTKAKM